MTQAGEPLMFEISRRGHLGVELPKCDVPVAALDTLLHEQAMRRNLPLPELSEPESYSAFYTSLSAKLFDRLGLLSTWLLYR